MASFSAVRADVYDREERKRHYEAHLMGLNAHDRHKKFMHDYVLYYNKSLEVGDQRQLIKTDQDTLRETYRFIRTEEDDSEISWEQKLAKRYYDKLFKEYCIADMTRFKEGKVGLRWRAEKEVVSGKGQFICGNKKCDANEGLASYEVNFTYKEAGESKQALVKLRVCSQCADKLNYKREKDHERIWATKEREVVKERRSQECQESSQCHKKRRHLPDVKAKSDDEQLRSKRSGFHSSSPQSKEQPHKPIGSQDEYEKYFKGMFL